MPAIAIYPGTFDPITYGHIDIITRAAKLFSQLIVAVVEKNTKDALFTLTERVALASEVLQHYPNIKIQKFNGLLVDFAKEQKAIAIVRGLRNTTDFNFEMQMVGMNQVLAPELETVFLTASADHTAISSTLVREIARLKGNVRPFVAESVAQALMDKFK